MEVIGLDAACIQHPSFEGYIYALHDPETGERRYIGKSKDPEGRLRKHLYSSYLKPDTYKNRWLRKLKRRGLRPLMIILSEVFAPDDIDNVERFWIRTLNCRNRLTNGTPGGDGGPTMRGRRMPPSAIAAIVAAQKGRKWAPDDPRRKQIRDRQKGVAPMHATRKALMVNCQDWVVTSPDGRIFQVSNLAQFCREQGLQPSKLYSVARGDEGRTHHKGWVCEKV